MEERALLSADEIKRLSADQVILIPERQNPLLVNRIVYFQDPTFLEIFKSQSGPLPYPSSDTAKVRDLEERMQATERKMAEIGKIEYLQKNPEPAKPKEPALAEEVAKAEDDTQDKDKTPDLATLTPSQDAAVAKMGKFSKRIAEIGG